MKPWSAVAKSQVLLPAADAAVVSLKFNSLRDFRPEGLAEQVPELRELLELRNALTALKGPLIGGNVPEFRKRLLDALRDPDKRAKLMRELGIEEPTKG